MEKEVMNILGSLYEPIVQAGEQLGNAIADAIEKAFEGKDNKKLE